MSTEAKIKPLDLSRYEGHTKAPWQLILHGNERYPYPLSIHTDDDAYWIARDGTVSNLVDARLLTDAPLLLAELRRNRRLLEAGEGLAWAATAHLQVGAPKGLRLALAAYQEAASVILGK